MSITVKDCLELPSLSLGKVIAGRGGLDNIVTSVSVMEFNDTDEEDILSPNELLISALFCVKDDVDAQCRLLRKARRSGDVGLVLFYSDLILGEISPRLIQVADFLNFPIILMPEADMGLKYSDVISDVTEAIYMDRSAENYFVSDTMQILAQSPEQERELSMVLKLAANYAKASFFLCDEDEKPISSAFWPASNYMELAKLQQACTARENHELRLLRRHFRDRKGTELILYGATWNNKLNSAMMGEVAETIQLFALMWNYNLDAHTSEALIPALLRGKMALADDICRRNRLNRKTLNRMLFLEMQDPGNTEQQEEIRNSLDRCFDEFDTRAIYDGFGSYFVIVYQNRSSVRDGLLETELDTLLSETDQVLTRTIFASDNLFDDAREFFNVFCDSLPVVRKIFPGKSSFTYSDIYFGYRVGLVMLSADSQDHYYRELLLPIVESKEKELMPTLLTYLLDCNAEIRRTAEALYVHRNTVLYRLNKIRVLLGFDLNQMPMAYDIYLAAALYRIRTGAEGEG